MPFQFLRGVPSREFLEWFISVRRVTHPESSQGLDASPEPLGMPARQERATKERLLFWAAEGWFVLQDKMCCLRLHAFLLAPAVEGQALGQREAHLVDSHCHSAEWGRALCLAHCRPQLLFPAVLSQTLFSSLVPRTPHPLIPDQKCLSQARNKAARALVLLSFTFFNVDKKYHHHGATQASSSSDCCFLIAFLPAMEKEMTFLL